MKMAFCLSRFIDSEFHCNSSKRSREEMGYESLEFEFLNTRRNFLEITSIWFFHVRFSSRVSPNVFVQVTQFTQWLTVNSYT